MGREAECEAATGAREPTAGSESGCWIEHQGREGREGVRCNCCSRRISASSIMPPATSASAASAPATSAASITTVTDDLTRRADADVSRECRTSECRGGNATQADGNATRAYGRRA